MVEGSVLIVKKRKKKASENNRIKSSKYVTGFLLGVLNPPVLIYWIVAFGIINNNNLPLSISSPLFVLFLFFIGVYLGKLLTLYCDSKFSAIIKDKSQNIGDTVNRATGVLLILIGIAQAIKMSS